MKREFTEEAFREFVMSDDLLAKRSELRATLEQWSHARMDTAAKLALAYLPAHAKIGAKVYPVVKPRSNSFVFDLANDPAVFVYLELLPADILEALVAHEFHHIGFANGCSSNEELPTKQAQLRRWLSAFGEGLATVAAAGGVDRKPRLHGDAAEDWEKQMQQLPARFKAAETFLLAVARGELDDATRNKQGMELFGVVGPWYTAGWFMAEVIENELGRDALIAAFCDSRELFATYNKAAKASGTAPALALRTREHFQKSGCGIQVIGIRNRRSGKPEGHSTFRINGLAPFFARHLH